MSHHHHHEGHGHDDCNDQTPALQNILHQQIDFDSIVTLNEAQPDSGAAIVKKTWTERLNPEPELQSDADEQILMRVPFTGQAKLSSILIRTSNSSSAPQTLKLFRNRNDVDFSSASSTKPTQKLTIPQSSDVLELPVNRALWNMTQSITLFFEDNYGHGEEDVTRISYLGFKGSFMPLNRSNVSYLYEAVPNPNDHTPIVGFGGVHSKMGTGK